MASAKPLSPGRHVNALCLGFMRFAIELSDKTANNRSEDGLVPDSEHEYLIMNAINFLPINRLFTYLGAKSTGGSILP
jgi:hypothetical protein